MFRDKKEVMAALIAFGVIVAASFFGSLISLALAVALFR